MSYRVDIPTLSANEVYTLTFEYEGTETIQLIVGDLTLETTDRRVVFTTTSPVNHIESNMNLINLNIYEGYYESDDFGGEYTQESYIEGKSLINLIQSQKHLDFQNKDCGVETFEDNMIKLTITDASSLTSTWQHGWIKTSANLKVGATYTCVIHVVENSISTEGIRVGANYGTLVHGSNSNSLVSGETGTIVFTYTTGTGTLKDYNGYYDAFCTVNHVGGWQNGSLKYGIMIFEGDYYDYFINNNVPYFEGIGCAKSPKILSQTKHRNIMLNTKPSATTNLITVSDDNTYIYLAEAARYSGLNFYFTQEYLAQHGISNGDKLCIELDGRLIEGTGTQAANTSTRIGIDACAWSDGSSGLNTVYKNLPENGHYCDYITINGNAGTIGISFLNNPDWTGTNKIYEIQNFRVYKIEDISEMGTYDCCEVSTPDDLELYCNHHYDRNTKTSNPCNQDTLDLTTGTLTRKNLKVKLNDVLGSKLLQGGLATVDSVDMVRVRYDHYSSSSSVFTAKVEGEVIGISATGITLSASQGSYEGSWQTTGDIEQAFTTTNTIFMYFNPSRFDGIDYTDPTTITNWIKEQDFTLIIKIQNASVYTEQLPTSINPLKSYRNGSIQTSSQQLAPTLKTTLPISNKFTTTNLTSGSTYNVYFDGTATKLDAGGTIITNPVSPCEVECGGTTLTIEGTDIQNVRVIETTVKNEVGSVCGTTDVELSRIKTKCELYNYFDEYKHDMSEWGGDSGCSSTRDDNKVVVTGKSSLCYSGHVLNSTSSFTRLPKGTYKFHCKVKVQNIGDQYRLLIHGNPNGANNNTDGFNIPVTTSTKLIEEVNYIGYFNGYVSCALFYAFANGQVVEYYDISLIKLSDEDITGTDTSSINYSQVISNLEQPIKLRSLGTTYDSYNPVTGELTKRIGVSETDGSYSVLSSPIVSQVEIDNIPHLYANGQVKVYSDSDVYPTTILNGQSTNNYEINELNKSNNYTIRYEGECESINLANKSNEQGTNRIVKSGTDGRGNLTFVNDSGDIDNVLLVQNDVREQEINHFTGLQTVEINQLLVSNKQNLFEAYMKNDFEFLNNVAWGAQAYGSLHNGVFKCGNLSAGSNLQWAWNLIKPHVDNVYGSRLKEDNPIVLANKVYNISFNISIVDHHTVNGNHNYNIRAFDFDGNEVSVQKATGGQAFLSTWSNGVTNPTTTNFINLDVIFSKDVYCFVLHADYGGQWAFDCTITDFTICEPENAKPEVPLVYEYIDLPQPVQLNSLPDGTCDTYNPITGEYVQNVGTIQWDSSIVNWNKTWSLTSSPGYTKLSHVEDWGSPNYETLVNEHSMPNTLTTQNSVSNNATMSREFNGGWSYFGAVEFGAGKLAIIIPKEFSGGIDEALQYLDENPIIINYKRTTPITTQLTPIEIPTFEGGILQLITTDGKVFPMIEYSMSTNNRYDTSSWEIGAVYTQRNMTEAYFNESTTPMTPTETMTLTTDHISSGSIILNDNGNGLIVLKGNYTGRDIPYFTGMRSVEAIEVETTPSPDQPLFGKGGRK